MKSIVMEKNSQSQAGSLFPQYETFVQNRGSKINNSNVLRIIKRRKLKGKIREINR
jgi:hypothetical protein